MSATDTRLDRPRAIAVARQFVDLIEDVCDTVVVAGSIRRRLAYVSDIEVVAVPKREAVELLAPPLHPEMFPDEARTETVDLLNLRMGRLLADGVVTKRLDVHDTPRWGPTLKYLWLDGVKIDLFAPSAERFGWILMLRTGPAAFSRQLVVHPRDGNARVLKTKDGRPGLLPLHIEPRDGWLTERVSAYRIQTPTEADVFELFGLPYREPWERS